MKKLLVLLLFIPLVSFAQITINTITGYSKINPDEKGVLYAAQKIDEGIIVSSFNLKENDDWAFSYMTNKEYIENQSNSNEIENNYKKFFEDFKILMKKDFYFKSVGNTYMLVFSFNQDGIEVVATIFQFIKNNKLYTASGSSVKNIFRESYNDYLKIIESIKF
jgi:hypothetical protein